MGQNIKQLSRQGWGPSETAAHTGPGVCTEVPFSDPYTEGMWLCGRGKEGTEV